MRRTHPNYHDQLSLSVHCFLLERLKKEPELLRLLKERWDIWLNSPDFACKPEYVQAWLDAISSGVGGVVGICTREDDQGQVLRSCSPIGALWHSPEERLEFMREWKGQHVR